MISLILLTEHDVQATSLTQSTSKFQNGKHCKAVFIFLVQNRLSSLQCLHTAVAELGDEVMACAEIKQRNMR